MKMLYTELTEPRISRALAPRLPVVIPVELAGLSRCYEVLADVKSHYPGFDAWFNNKVIRGCVDGTRAVFAAVSERREEICGVVIAKRDLTESKICTLFVDPRFVGVGNGTRLLSRAVNWLKVPRPIITVDESKRECFRSIFAAHDFVETAAIRNLYHPGRLEYIYNDFEGRYQNSSRNLGLLEQDRPKVSNLTDSVHR